MPELSVIDTDVLIIGSGAAGLRAAIAAHEVGVNVLLVSKMPLGRNNCTEFSAGEFFFANSGISKEEHFERTIEAGRHLNDPNLARILCDEAPHEVRRLTDFGVRADFHPHGASTASYSPPLRRGFGLTHSLVQHVGKLGIKTQAWVMIVELVKNQVNQFCGALGLQVKSGKLIYYRAKSAVLATGGVGELFTFNDNPVGMTGDGYALAYQAGAKLIDMEFIQFFPIGTAASGFPHRHLSLQILDKCPVINRNGKEFLKEKMQEFGIQDGMEASRVFRDQAARVVALEIYEGRGEDNTVLLDLSRVPDSEWEQGYLHFLKTKLLRRFDYQQGVLHVAPIYHYMMGGVQINEYGMTTLPGLYAAGEVAGGVHGANRHGGNALSETIVFGKRAGEAAALYAKGLPSVEKTKDITLPKKTQAILQRLMAEKKPKISPKVLKQQIRKLNDEHLHIVRTKTGLINLIAQLELLNTRSLHAQTPKELMQAFEILNLILVSKLVAISALTRQESRGAHYRHDCPEADPSWLKHTVITKRGQKPEVTYQAV
ncbi:MAG: FAD-binding protein [Candidatus Heimdallarchaeota archaeon]